jgi:hypothetical protein
VTREEVLAILEGQLRFGPVSGPTDNVPAFCPFHKGGQERTPALYVYVGPSTPHVQTGSAYCHTCGQGWSLPSLLRKLGMPHNTIEVVQRFLKESGPAKRKPHDLCFDLPVLPEMTLGMFDYCPKALLQEGFTEEVLQQFEIGFDRTRDRITFPLRDHLGNLVGISGRAVRDGQYPRYKIYTGEFAEVYRNYQFHKGRLVWGLHRFYQASLNQLVEPVVVCEGFKAAMWVAQAGHPHVVALLGTYASAEQRALLLRTTSRVVLFLDNDSAGLAATPVMADLLGGADVLVANYGTDNPISPDDLSGPQVTAAINTAVSPTRLKADGKWQLTTKSFRSTHGSDASRS